MAPKSIMEKVPNLLISTTEYGVQDHNSLINFYKFFDSKLTEKMLRPVSSDHLLVVLTDLT